MCLKSKRRVTIDIDLVALSSNLSVVRKARPSARVFCVLKADAYGHGAVECAIALASPEHSELPPDGFAVVFPGEAEELRSAGITEPILVLQGPANREEVRWLQDLDVWSVIHDEHQCALLENFKFSSNFNVWLKIDTGMGRLGVQPAQVPTVLEGLRRTPGVSVVGTLSHLASADIAGNSHTQQQIQTYRSATEAVAEIDSSLAGSLANSAGVLAWPETEFDWIRPGIMLYGSSPLLSNKSSVQLTPVMQVTTTLIAHKQYRRGEGVGYGQTYTCPEAMPVGYAAIGYGDGLPRLLKDAVVMINGQRVPVIGRVSMDSIALDLRKINATPGDQVLLWGPGLPVDEMAAAADTISYELLCSIKGNRCYPRPGSNC